MLFEEVQKTSSDVFLQEKASKLTDEYAHIFTDVHAAITRQKRQREVLQNKQKANKGLRNENSNLPDVFVKSESSNKINIKQVKIKNSEDLEKALSVFDQYVGFDSLKENLRDIAYFSILGQKRFEKGIVNESKPAMHMVFKGAPGTGKTTAARLLGDFFKDLGILSKGHLVEVDRSKLVGEYIGQSEKITRDVLAKAKGGILFIDEVYSLLNGSERDFGKPVIELLVKAMEDMREDLIVIMAGYDLYMDQFLNSSPGLRSRVSIIIEFPEFKQDQLIDIFENLCAQEKYILSELAREKVYQYLLGVKSFKLGSFGNARGVRNLFDLILKRQARRVLQMKIEDTEGLSTIFPQDVPGKDRPNDPNGSVTYLPRK